MADSLPMEEEEGPAIGIDLGTSNSCVGVWWNNNVEIIANNHGSRTTPSWVAFIGNQFVVGEGAKDQAARNTTNTIYDTKRLVGRRFSDETVRNNIDLKRWPFKIVEGYSDKPMIEVSYMGEQKKFSAEQISSMVLVKMKETAEVFLGAKVKNVVITVPAYFNNAQRQATIDAGMIAQLNVMRIINEPTAAAIAYGLEINAADCNDDARTILVFDLGGGTFDVSLVVVGRESFEVKAVGGDTHLGGVDFDNKMVEYFVEEFSRRHNKDIRGNLKALAKLRAQCERAKIVLSTSTETSINIDFIDKTEDFSSTIHRQQFESMNLSLFKGCIEPVSKCLADAKMKKSDVDDVVLVGGSSRIPKVQELLQECFEGKVLCKKLNPDEAVAYGAAIQAAILSGVRHAQHRLTDVTPLSLGVELASGEMSVMIPRNTHVPTRIEKEATTSKDDQTNVSINIYEGENPKAKDNNLLGKFSLHGIPPAPKGVAKLTNTFEIDEDNILTVTSEQVSTGKKNQITITAHSGKLSKNEIDRMVGEAKKYQLGNEEHKKQEKVISDISMFLSNMSVSLRSKENKMKDEDKEKLEDVIKTAYAWLNSNAGRINISMFEEKLIELQDTFKPPPPPNKASSSRGFWPFLRNKDGN